MVDFKGIVELTTNVKTQEYKQILKLRNKLNRTTFLIVLISLFFLLIGVFI